MISSSQLCKKKLALKLHGDESMSADCVDELNELLPFVEKQFSSKNVFLKSVAEEVLVTVTRMIINCENESAKQPIINFFADATKSLCLQRRSFISVQIIEDIVGHRFPSFFIPRLWDPLIDNLEASTFLYNQSVVCDLILSVAKRYSGFDEACKGIIRKSLPNILKVLFSIVQQWLENKKQATKPFDLSSKRSKPLLDLVKYIFSSNQFSQHEISNDDLVMTCKTVLNELKNQIPALSKSVDGILEAVEKHESKDNKKRKHQQDDDSKKKKKK